ncbi:MAG: ABC transporter ATP-binding protein [Oscillospiraceae bacterium]|nr:ABC transporter ATP-binding protein [Oscillospiraceae bacterium]
MTLLDVKSVSKRYQRGAAHFFAVENASLALGAGEFVCVTGHSGSGKSTLLNIIAGLLPPSAGAVTFDATELTSLGDAELSYLRNTQIGYIPQGHSVLANLTVLENVCLPFYLYPRVGNPADRAGELLAEVGIAHLAHSYPAELSGGELRRVSIARGLVNAPRLLIADEPTGDLDRRNSDGVMELFSAVAKSGTAVLVVTHETESLRYCDRHLQMENGKLT